MNWQAYYKLPLSIDENCGWVVAQPNEMTGFTHAFDWVSNSRFGRWIGTLGDDIKEAIVAKINGNYDGNLLDGYVFKTSDDPKDPCTIMMNNEPAILIRGWGMLTGCGSFKLDGDVAAKIQDDFRDYIIETLNK